MVRSLKLKHFSKSKLVSILSTLALAYSISIFPAYSQQIIPDGYTATSLNTNGNVTNVSTTTITNKNAFNSFSRFNVDAGNTVNLLVPNNAQNLINIVKNETSNINGILNSLKNGVTGGNIYLVNPYGVFIGSQGVVNVGSLTAITPTKQFTDNFFDSPGNPNQQAVNAILNNTAPLNDQASVNVLGKISATDAVKVNAGNIVNKGVIEIADIVNLDGLSNAGNISLVAAKNLDLDSGSVVDASARTAKGDAGSIYIFGNDQVNFNSGAKVDISGGEVSGNGGFVEISSNNNVLVGGKFISKVVDGKQGEILVDPPTLDLLTNQFSLGANMTFTADNRITVHEGVVVSSRNVTNPEGVDHTSAPSIGNSGNITFNVGLAGNTGVMNFDLNSVVASWANNGFTPGQINIISDNINVSVNPGIMNFYPGDEEIAFSRHTAGDAAIVGVKGIPDNVLRLTPAELQTVYLGTAVFGNSANTNNLTANITVEANPARQFPLVIGANTLLTVNAGLNLNMGGTDLTLLAPTLTVDPAANITANNIGLVYNTLNFNVSDPGTQVTTAIDEGRIFLSRYSAGNIDFQAGSGTVFERLNGNILIGNDAFTNQYTNDVLIGDQLNRGNNDFTIQANGNILDNTGAETPNLVTRHLTLNSANGSVGLYNDSIDVSLNNGGQLISNAWGYIGISALGDMLIDNITNAGRYDVKLESTADILVGNAGQANNIVARGLQLIAPTGIIGNDVNALRINTNADPLYQDGVFNAISGGNTFINETSGELRLGTVTNFGLGNMTLTGSGGIVDASAWEQPNIYTNGLTLRGQNGTLGLQVEDLDVYTNFNSVGGVLDATADADVNIFQYMDNLLVNQAVSNFGTIIVGSDSSILDGNAGSEAANISGSTISLNSIHGGSLGLYSDSLDINLTSGNLSAAVTNGFVWLRETTNALPIQQISNGGEFDMIIEAPNNILNGRVDANPNIITRGLLLNNSANGTIGNAGTSLNVSTNSNGAFLGGTLTALSQGLINIFQSTGDLQVASVSNAGRDDVALYSTGSIYDAKTWNDEPNVYGRDIILNASSSDIGVNGGEDFDVAVNYNAAVGGSLHAFSAQFINIAQTNGNLQLRNAYATGTVTVNADAGGIFNAGNPGELNITQPNIINLNATTSIGTVANPVQVRILPGGQVNAVSPDTHVNQN